MDGYMILEVILSILLPPLAVLIHRGAGSEFLINIILWLLFWIPGTIHALYVIFTMPPKKQVYYLEKKKVQHNFHSADAPVLYQQTTTTTYEEAPVPISYNTPTYNASSSSSSAPVYTKSYSTYQPEMVRGQSAQ